MDQAVVKIWTMQLARWRLARQNNITILDITAKSGIQAFAPEFHNVMEYKAGRLTQEEYTELYHEKMARSKLVHPGRWDMLKQHERVALTCYCPAGKFCHRHLFAKLMVEHLHGEGVEVQQMGELLPEGMNSNPPTEPAK